MKNSIAFRLWGRSALFSDPVTKIGGEKCSYHIPTYEALRGVATMPYPFVEKDIAEGRLRVVSPEYTSEVDIIMAWRRDSMGEAKSWCLREIPKLFAHHNK